MSGSLLNAGWPLLFFLGFLVTTPLSARGQAGGETNAVRIVELQGPAQVFLNTARAWSPALTNQILHPFDRVRSEAHSRVALLWLDQSVVSFAGATEIEILPAAPNSQPGLHLISGVISFFHRGSPSEIKIITRGAVAGVEGTEFVLSADAADKTTLSVIDGKVQFGNELGSLSLTNGEQAVVELNQRPVRTTGFIANNLLQWCFYYPAVLDLNDLSFAPEERVSFRQSLLAYEAGDLPAALAGFSGEASITSADGQIYYAALLLSAGEVDNAEKILAAIPNDSERVQRLADSLRELIAAVMRQPLVTGRHPQYSSELLAASYYEQSRGAHDNSLRRALDFALLAATNSPRSGFAWARVAELEFCFGRESEALAALAKSLSLAPRNAQAVALKGFIFLGRNQPAKANDAFQEALGIDSSFGNAWLGRGISRIRLSDAIGGREDLLVAAALEPRRAELRSYLGKAYANAGDISHATRELERAKKMDPDDATPWLYSALLNQENNRVNEAIGDLEKSEELNDNRQIYRSQLLLDKDQAIRSANLAAIYRDAGMFEVGLNEAARAENFDYANYSAHLFLANSYQQLLDPQRANLRYEAAMGNEYLLANLLSPAAAGALSPALAQRDHTTLFKQNYMGISSDTAYLSRGAWEESAVQYGTYGNFSYAFEGDHQSDNGERVNDDFERNVLSWSFKQQLTPADSLYASIQTYESSGGDVHDYYDPSMASSSFRYKESQQPTTVLGYHHEWGPGCDTLLLFARVTDDFSFTNMNQAIPLAFRPEIGPGEHQLTSVQSPVFDQQLENELTLYSGEIQQILQTAKHTTIVGARLQYGDYQAVASQSPRDFVGVFVPGGYVQDVNNYFSRVSVYGYHQWQIVEPLRLIGGLTYDSVTYPRNVGSLPLSDAEGSIGQWSPKAGLIWTPAARTTVRLAYTRSVMGANLDQSYQLEPSQVAGFLQSYRSVIPETISATSPGTQIESYGISLEHEFPTRTYVTAYGGVLNAHVSRSDGSFDIFPPAPYAVISDAKEVIDYSEKTFQLTINQLLGDEWSLGAQYRISDAKIKDDYPELGTALFFDGFQPRKDGSAVLQQLSLYAIYNHPSGFFARGETSWYQQDNYGYHPHLSGDDFWQANVFAGWRCFHRRAEISAGILNLADQGYRLNPLNLYSDLPHERTFSVRFKLNF